MNRYLLFRRIRGPVYLLTFGVTALLDQWGVLPFGRSWPLYLIVAGLLRLVETSAFLSGAFPAAYPSPGVGGSGATVAGWEQGNSSGNASAFGTSSPLGLTTMPPAPSQPATLPTVPYTPVREEER